MIRPERMFDPRGVRPADCRWLRDFGQHGKVYVYDRPASWRFRKRLVRRCWLCDYRLVERRP